MNSSPVKSKAFIRMCSDFANITKFILFFFALKDKKQEKVFIRKEMFLFNNLPGLYFFPAGEACVIRILLTTPAAMAKNMANNKQACARCPSANIRNNKATSVVPKV